LPFLVAEAAGSGDGILWAFSGLCLFFLGIPTYAFAKAALGQQVRCRLEGGRMLALYRGKEFAADVGAVRLRLTQRQLGRSPFIGHSVVLGAPGWREELTLHMGFTNMGAQGAARRASEHFRVQLPNDA
jgi:hypothetical protein